MTILVTGGAGFIGSHLAERLLRQGERVLILDNFNNYYDPALKWANAERLKQYVGATVIEGDIRSETLMNQIFKAYGVRKVAHMAAMAGVRSSMEQVPLYMAVNVTGTMHLLEAARMNKVEMFVMASTSSVYGETQRLPFTEDDAADRPLAAYPASKRSAEILAHSYHHLFEMNITALRFFNVYGPAGRPDMMPMKMMHAITQGEAITVFNEGNLQRDWTYIEDTVDGVYAALQRPLGYEVINLGVGQPISLNDFIGAIEALAGKTAVRVNIPTPLSDPPITYCNNEKARRLLDFNPQTTVQQGIEKMWAWFSEVFL
jgi:UDP-glucuronate 4-epimerase